MGLKLVYKKKRRCEGCRRKSRVFIRQRITDTPLYRCQHCNKRPVVKTVKMYRHFEKHKAKMAAIGGR